MLWEIEDQSHPNWVMKKKRLGTAAIYQIYNRYSSFQVMHFMCEDKSEENYFLVLQLIAWCSLRSKKYDIQNKNCLLSLNVKLYCAHP